jgi:hypothetical protein
MFLNRKLVNLTFVNLEDNVGLSAILKKKKITTKDQKSVDFVFAANVNSLYILTYRACS